MVIGNSRHGFQAWLMQQWQQRSAWQLVLTPLACLYRCVITLRQWAYRLNLATIHALPVPVIVVGNLTVGGTGKTPLVIWLAQQLQAAGKHPGIISRGYGGDAHVPLAVTADSDAAQTGDEAVLLARQTSVPVWVGRNRPLAARELLAKNPETNVLLSDDGLQHLALGRDIEIAVIDAIRGFGNTHLLPAGPLREPLSRLNSIDMVVLNQTGTAHPSLYALPAHYTMQLVSAPIYALKAPHHHVNVHHFSGEPLHAIAGIGHPQRFFDQLQAAGLAFTAHSFPDHHAFQANELNFPGNLIMTEKDAVKCKAFATDKMWVWPVAAQVDATLMPHLLSLLDAYNGQ
jgi:tetraacyldisaccharide 4'-kinase